MKKDKELHELYEKIKKITRDYFDDGKGRFILSKYYESIDCLMSVTTVRMITVFYLHNEFTKKSECKKLIQDFINDGLDGFMESNYDLLLKNLEGKREGKQ